jgi:glycine cleavage system H protein
MKTLSDIRRYAEWHIWIEMEDEFIGRCGISDLYLDKLDVIEFVDLPYIDNEVRKEEKTGRAESGRAYFDIRSPVSGRITEINRLLEDKPSLINDDTYGKGWIYKIDLKDPNELYELMEETEYRNNFFDRGDI